MYVSKGKCYLKRKRFLNEVSHELVDTLKQIYFLRNEVLSEAEIKDEAKKYALKIEAACLTPKYKMSNDEYHNILIMKTRELCDVLTRTMIPNNLNVSNSTSQPSHMECENFEGEKNIKKGKVKQKGKPSKSKVQASPKNSVEDAMGISESTSKSSVSEQFVNDLHYPPIIRSKGSGDQRIDYSEQYKSMFKHLKSANSGNVELGGNDSVECHIGFTIPVPKDGDILPTAVTNDTSKDPFDFAESGLFDSYLKETIEFEDAFSFM